MILEFDKEVKQPEYNNIDGDVELINSKIIFKGKGNRIVSSGRVRLRDSQISFNGDDALLILSNNKKHPYKIKLDLWRGTTTYFGCNSYFNGVFQAIVSERKNLIIGSDSIFSFGIWIRTADPHLIYDIGNHRRVNPSKSVLIGDHVWIGQNATILKGSTIGSGSIISANAVVANKRLESNAVYAGNPVRKVREGVFFRSNSVHNYTEADTDKSMFHNGSEYIYQGNGKSVSIEEIDKAMENAGLDTEKRKEKLLELLINKDDHNRFYIGKQKVRKKLFFK